ncbi:hypothetical protein [Paenibacillus periandrae]|nr:hypothetical protein [Paenibacillus periandrae]
MAKNKNKKQQNDTEFSQEIVAKNVNSAAASEATNTKPNMNSSK